MEHNLSAKLRESNVLYENKYNDGDENFNDGESVDDFINDHSLPHPDDLIRLPKHETEGKKILETLAGISGNVLEWYDFAVFGYFSDIIGDVFFPPQNGHAAIVESFVVFGLAFFMRPLGGLLMGYIGDVYGRKKALETSLFLMAVPTFIMGLLPSYNQIGWWSIVLLTLIRMLQGLSVGGQLVSSLVFTLENKPKEKWGLYGSYVMTAASTGTLLGNLVAAAIRASLSDDQLHSWGWRLPFLSGILVGVSGLYLKFFCEDTNADFIHGKDDEEISNPIKAAFSRENRKSLVSATLVPMLWSTGFYFQFVWVGTFMHDLVNEPVPGSFWINAISLLFSVCLLFPVAGILSDKFGRTKIMYIGGVMVGVLCPILLIVIGQGNPYNAFIAQFIMGISLCLWGAPMCAWLVESFPVQIRLTSVAVGYNIAQISGGVIPALATLLADDVWLYSPGFYVTFIAFLSIYGLYSCPPRP